MIPVVGGEKHLASRASLVVVCDVRIAVVVCDAQRLLLLHEKVVCGPHKLGPHIAVNDTGK